MTTQINSYKDLIVWQKGYELVKMVYKISSKLPHSEVYALQSQVRRSAVSIVSNIAEGTNRKTRKDYCQFLHLSYGSAAELETQLFLCRDLYKLPVEEELELLIEVSKMLRTIINKLEPSN
jgi:four helix bundle protein